MLFRTSNTQVMRMIELLSVGAIVLNGVYQYKRNQYLKPYYPFRYIPAQDKDKFTFAIGYDKNLKPVVFDFSQSPNLLIGGITNSGKSVCLHSIIYQSLLNYPTLELHLFDFKGGIELFYYSKLPNCKTFVYEPEKAYERLSEIFNEIKSVLVNIRNKGYRNAREYNKGNRNKIPFRLIVMDECMQLDKKSQEILKKIVSICRAINCYVILSSQRFDSKNLDSAIKCNIESRIAFKVADRVNSEIILDRGGAEFTTIKGRCLCYNNYTYLQCQCFYIEDKLIKKYVDKNGVEKDESSTNEERHESHQIFKSESKFDLLE
ncbi:hypothetical protein GMB50_11760 [Turicibacter sanguinis]|nr:hypothetical protein [Turicibacter sanguinis]MTP48196.1 hypothetical protein [Turicibacter sanguinis]MTP49478.1 hypothetical protein [Turicibacter sanguinis]MTQ06909.1 hypothetical protein [Turicibacter sanguinis]